MAFPCQIKTPQGLPAAREVEVSETVSLSGQQAQYDKERLNQSHSGCGQQWDGRGRKRKAWRDYIIPGENCRICNAACKTAYTL